MSNIKDFLTPDVVKETKVDLESIIVELKDVSTELHVDTKELDVMLATGEAIAPCLESHKVTPTTVAMLSTSIESLPVDEYNKYRELGHMEAAQEAVIDTLKDYGKKVWEAIKKAFKAIIKGIRKVWSMLIRLYNKIFKNVDKVVEELSRKERVIELTDENIELLGSALAKVFTQVNGNDPDTTIDNLDHDLAITTTIKNLVNFIIHPAENLHEIYSKTDAAKLLKEERFVDFIKYMERELGLHKDNDAYIVDFYDTLKKKVLQYKETVKDVSNSDLIDKYMSVSMGKEDMTDRTSNIRVMMPDGKSGFDVIRFPLITNNSSDLSRCYCISYDTQKIIVDPIEVVAPADVVKFMISDGREVIDDEYIAYKNPYENKYESAILKAIFDIRKESEVLDKKFTNELTFILTRTDEIISYINNYMEELSTRGNVDMEVAVRVGDVVHRYMIKSISELVSVASGVYSTYTKNTIAALTEYVNVIHKVSEVKEI